MRVIPGELATAAEDLGNIGTRLEEVNAVAALPTSSILPALNTFRFRMPPSSKISTGVWMISSAAPWPNAGIRAPC